MSTIAEMADYLRSMGESEASVRYLILKATEDDAAPEPKPAPLPYTAPATDTGD